MSDNTTKILSHLLLSQLSDFQDDYPKTVPKWLVRKIERYNNQVKSAVSAMSQIRIREAKEIERLKKEVERLTDDLRIMIQHHPQCCCSVCLLANQTNSEGE